MADPPDSKGPRMSENKGDRGRKGRSEKAARLRGQPEGFPKDRAEADGGASGVVRLDYLERSAQPAPAPAAGLVGVGKAPFALLDPPAAEPFALLPADSPSVSPEGVSIFLRLVGPAAGLLFAHGDLGPDQPRGSLRRDPVVVVALFGHEFLHCHVAAQLRKVGLRRDHGRGGGGAATPVSGGNGGHHDGFALQTHGAFRLTGLVCGAVQPPRNPRAEDLERPLPFHAP